VLSSGWPIFAARWGSAKRKRQYAGLEVSELRELRQLREENGRLKRLVADLSVDRQILQEIVSKKL
jgi:putative transposase